MINLKMNVIKQLTLNQFDVPEKVGADDITLDDYLAKLQEKQEINQQLKLLNQQVHALL